MEKFMRLHTLINERRTEPGAYYFPDPWWKKEVDAIVDDLERQLSSLSANAVMKNSIGLQRCSMILWTRPEASSFWTLFAKGYSLSKTLNGRKPLLRISAQQLNTSTTKTSEEAGIPSLLPFYFSRPLLRQV